MSYVCLCQTIFGGQLKEMDDVDMLTLVIQEMSKKFPTLMDTLVHERDQLVLSLTYNVLSPKHIRAHTKSPPPLPMRGLFV